jgi:hypothetical protein
MWMQRRESVSWWAGLTWALPLLVVVPMLALASALGTHEIIFPEGAALAMGIWVVGLPGWSASRWRLATLPALFASGGVLLLSFDLPATVATVVAVTAALLGLQAFGTRLAPAMSAAVLPVVFDVRAWSYPAAVLTISVVVTVGMARWPAAGGAEMARRRAAHSTGSYPWRVVTGAWLVIVLWIVAGGELLGLPSAALAPPLFVSALEWLGRGSLVAEYGVRRWTLLVGAGLAGSGAVELVPVAWIGGALAVVATIALMRLLATPHPPALAIALIPQILDTSNPLRFTLAVAAGAGALYIGVYGVSRVGARPRQARASRLSRA